MGVLVCLPGLVTRPGPLAAQPPPRSLPQLWSQPRLRDFTVGRPPFPPVPLPVSPEVLAAHPPRALPSPCQSHMLCSAAPSPASFRLPRGLPEPAALRKSSGWRQGPGDLACVGGNDRQAPRARASGAAILGPAGAMGSWALRAALLCLGGALVYSKLHTPHRDRLIPAQEQASKPGPEAGAPEEEEPFTKGSISPTVLTASPQRQNSAAPRPSVALPAPKAFGT